MSPKPNGKRRAVAIGLGLALLAGLGFGAFRFTHPSHTLSDTEHLGVVKRIDLVQNVTVAGSIIPKKRTTFSPAYAAYIRKIYVKLGDSVQAGDPIISLEQSLRSTHETIFPLRAPFAGKVVQILHAEGEYVENGKDTSPMIRIDDISRLFLTSTIPETEIEKLKIGQKVIIKVNAVTSKSYDGVIREIFGAATEKQGGSGRPGERVEFQIKIEILHADAALMPGMSTIIDIITEKKRGVLAIPHEFIEKEKDEYFVTLQNGKRQKIVIGLQNDQMIEVREGVSEGDKVRMVDFAALPQEG